MIVGVAARALAVLTPAAVRALLTVLTVRPVTILIPRVAAAVRLAMAGIAAPVAMVAVVVAERIASAFAQPVEEAAILVAVAIVIPATAEHHPAVAALLAP